MGSTAKSVSTISVFSLHCELADTYRIETLAKESRRNSYDASSQEHQGTTQFHWTCELLSPLGVGVTSTTATEATICGQEFDEGQQLEIKL